MADANPIKLCACGCGREAKYGLCVRGHYAKLFPRKKHGHSYRPIYRVWHAMVQRCTNHNNAAWHLYGGRGITVCAQWLTFAGFLVDMWNRPEGTMIDRIDNDGNYEPGNCRWSSPREQANNRRTNRFIEYRGETRTLSEWARLSGLTKAALKYRLDAGWDLNDAMTTKPLSHSEGMYRRWYGPTRNQHA